MLIEQAFFNLPEIMVGNGYDKQEYEGGIVSAFSLALLQQFNGRNINNPISSIYAERSYIKENIQKYLNASCAFRCDLYIDLEKTNLNNTNLYTYGFRTANYIETKFFRNSKDNSTLNVYNILLDIYRLQILPIYLENKYKNGTSKLGRYFLHVYKGKPHEYIGNKFSWLAKKLVSGDQEIIIDLNEDSAQFCDFPQLIKSTLNVTNFVIEYHGNNELYTFILTRVNTFLVKSQNGYYKISKDGEICHNQHLKVLKEFISEIKASANQIEKINKDINDKVKSLIESDIINYLNQNQNKIKIQALRQKIAIQRKKTKHFNEYEEILNSIYDNFKDVMKAKKVFIKIESILSGYYCHLLARKEIKKIAKERVVTCLVDNINQFTNEDKTKNQQVFKQALIEDLEPKF